MKKQKFQVANEATPEAAVVETAAAQTVETENQNIETETVNENGTPETTPTAAAEHTPEAPTQKAETIEELQQRLDVELARLSHKRQLANNRQKFINSMGSLQIYIDDLKNEKEFETKSGKITFKVLEADRYDRTDFVDTFSITDTALIQKFCNVLYNEMKQKKAELETLLLTA